MLRGLADIRSSSFLFLRFSFDFWRVSYRTGSQCPCGNVTGAVATPARTNRPLPASSPATDAETFNVWRSSVELIHSTSSVIVSPG